ncbi:MFS transporter [Microbispora sp. SCL1-1]|uniref:MFS transporter n=1 Tax=unclassified Microbispora TaxID=2614687 RepID=UPI0011573B9C|nr:MFS transporter [Microbispora sp. SCL1-1]NJP23751.1 MFS transporter [Microbispora sp. CL1-1]TQS15955.1 MFS transporter [Microbispora sp. SCL1-1]
MAGPALGAVVDVLGARPVLVWTNVVMGAALCLLFLVRSPAQVWLVFAVLLLYGVSFVVLDAAEAAVLPDAVPETLLAGVNGLRMSASEGTRLAAPLLGAGLFAVAGGDAVVALDAATFAAGAWLLGTLRLPAAPVRRARVTRGWAARTAEGARFLFRDPLLGRLMLSGAALMLVSGVNGALVFAVVDHGLHQEPGFTGVLSAIQGGGTVLGGMIAGPLLRRAGEARLAAAGGLLYAASVALRALPSTPVVAAASLLSGLGLPWVLVAALTAVQRIAPRDLLATVSATANTVLFVPTAVGMALGAGLLALTSYRPVLWAAAFAGALAAAYARRRPRRAVTTPDRDTSAAC